jgi:hypothetical protein
LGEETGCLGFFALMAQMLDPAPQQDVVENRAPIEQVVALRDNGDLGCGLGSPVHR